MDQNRMHPKCDLNHNFAVGQGYGLSSVWVRRARRAVTALRNALPSALRIM